MGRKSQSKQAPKKNSGKENNRFALQKRKELAILVDKVLRLTSVFQASTTSVAKSWEQHLEIDAILKEIANIESPHHKNFFRHRKSSVEIAEFEGYELGLKATKDFAEGSLILTIPSKVMMTEKDARESILSEFIAIDPLLQNMPNITLALFLLLEKNNP
ncbi:Histone-lysine N-methyltransferase setd3, partial [Operophtera brumata]